MKPLLRLSLVVVLGNMFGYGFFRLAAWAAPQWWRAAGRPIPFGLLLFLIGLTAIAFATPPMIVSALAARVAARNEPLVGLAVALWGVTARQWWPENVPLLPPESWVAPMAMILVSGLVGGWLAGSHPSGLAARFHSSPSNDPSPPADI